MSDPFIRCDVSTKQSSKDIGNWELWGAGAEKQVGSHLLIWRLTAVAACSAVLVNGRGNEGGGILIQ